MPKLFEPTQINGMELKNRFVRSATWEGMAAEDGNCTPQLIDLMTQLAKGDIGLIVASYAFVLPEGKARIGQIGFYKDELIDGLEEMTEAVHEYGSKIVAQLVHAGIYSDPQFTGETPLAPSHIPELVDTPHEEMSIEYIQEVVKAFGAAAARAKEAGFDGVQIHAAHEYLYTQFLSPFFNRRNDAYGGSVENRARIVLESVDSMRASVGPGFPILIKMNCQDFLDGGLTLEDSLKFADMLQKRGIDAIELSGGTRMSGDLGPVRPGISSKEKEAYFRKEAKLFKEMLKIPLILVGGIRSMEVAEQVLDQGLADYISMCRPFIREPDLVKRWAAGDKSKATCISDSQCRDAAFSGKGICCVIDKKIKEKSEREKN